MRGHPDPLVEPGRCRWDDSASTCRSLPSSPTRGESVERPSEQRLADAATPVGGGHRAGQRSRATDPPSTGPGADIANKRCAVPGEEPEIGIEAGRRRRGARSPRTFRCLRPNGRRTLRRGPRRQPARHQPETGLPRNPGFRRARAAARQKRMRISSNRRTSRYPHAVKSVLVPGRPASVPAWTTTRRSSGASSMNRRARRSFSATTALPIPRPWYESATNPTANTFTNGCSPTTKRHAAAQPSGASTTATSRSRSTDGAVQKRSGPYPR